MGERGELRMDDVRSVILYIHETDRQTIILSYNYRKNEIKRSRSQLGLCASAQHNYTCCYIEYHDNVAF